jgi:Tfp pilus assembly protein PilN
MKVINLLPKEELKKIRLELTSGQIIKFWSAVVFVMVLLLLAAWGTSFYLKQQAVMLSQELEDKRAQLNTNETRRLESEVKMLNSQIKLVQDLRSNHYYWSRALIELVYMLDTDAVLTHASFDKATGQIVVQGRSGTRQGILNFWANVVKSDMFEKINFPLTNLERDVNADFTFTFYVKPEKLKN